MSELIEAELEPYRTDSPGRLRIGGPAITLDSPQAIALGLVVNELATNALKHGALSRQQGKLDVRWIAENDRLILNWRESDGPKVRAAAIENFGSRLLRRLVEGQLAGTVRRELSGDGVTCVVEFPLGIMAGEARRRADAEADQSSS